MQIEDFNTLVEQAYKAAFAYEKQLVAVYERAYARQTEQAATRFTAITAAWTPPIYETLSDGMNEKEVEQADKVRDEAALAILAILTAAGVAASSREFMEAISKRAQLNFEQEILRQLRKVVSDSFTAGLSSEETAAAIRAQIPQVIPSSAEMLAQTELTSLVNERSIAAAQKQFPDGVSKTWLTVGDNRVRAAHAKAQGQTVPIEQPFNIGGASLMYPGDPSGPLRLVARCRCRLSYTNDPTAVTAGGTDSAKEDTMSTMELRNEAGEVVGHVISPVGYSENDFAIFKETFSTDTNMTAGITVTITETEDDSEVEDQTEDTAEKGVEEMADGPAWKALLAVEGVPTGDGRMIAEGALTWREPPLSLMAMDETTEGGHLGAKVAGRVDTIWRDGNEVWAAGVFNGNDFGLHIAELVGSDSLNGNSIDPAGVTTEIWDPETMKPVAEGDLMDAMLAGKDLLMVFTHYEIGATTVCPVQALSDAKIMLASGVLNTRWFQEQPTDSLTASAAGMAPLHPPAAWFQNPKFDRETGLIVTDEGRVMGHAAGWNSCHIGEPRGPGICVPPPRSGMSYEVFHHGLIRTAEGEDIPCGPITMSTLHATDEKTWKTAREHYEHSGCVVADVVAGEDRFGIWVSGALRPNISAERVREFKAGALSGDWRDVIGRGLEFLGALVVNIPGFPIPRPRAVVVASANGEERVLALTAAGIVPPEPEVGGMSRREYLRRIRALTTFADDPCHKPPISLPDGSFPIANCSDAENAIRAQGRAKDQAAVVAHIKKRVKALGCTGDIFKPYQ